MTEINTLIVGLFCLQSINSYSKKIKLNHKISVKAIKNKENGHIIVKPMVKW